MDGGRPPGSRADRWISSWTAGRMNSRRVDRRVGWMGGWNPMSIHCKVCSRVLGKHEL